MRTSRAVRAAAVVLACLFAAAGLGAADLHLAGTQSTSWVDSPRARSSSQELWAGKDKEWSKTDGRIRITRRDLGVVWSIDTKAGTYAERALAKAGASPATAPEEKLHNDGYEYEPVFDWTFKDMGLEEDVAGIRCRKFVLDGDADLSEKVIELWAAADLGPAVPGDDRTQALLTGRTEAGALVERWKELKGLFILREKVTEDPPIGGTYVRETVLTKLESAEPPAGIYDLPSGLKKIEPGEAR